MQRLLMQRSSCARGARGRKEGSEGPSELCQEGGGELGGNEAAGAISRSVPGLFHPGQPQRVRYWPSSGSILRLFGQTVKNEPEEHKKKKKGGRGKKSGRWWWW